MAQLIAYEQVGKQTWLIDLGGRLCYKEFPPIDSMRHKAAAETPGVFTGG
jgi:hypothetical protein